MKLSKEPGLTKETTEKINGALKPGSIYTHCEFGVKTDKFRQLALVTHLATLPFSLGSSSELATAAVARRRACQPYVIANCWLLEGFPTCLVSNSAAAFVNTRGRKSGE